MTKRMYVAQTASAFALAILLAVSAEALAQRPAATPEQRAERIESRVAFYTDQLNLTEEQQAEVRNIITGMQEHRQAFMASRERGERGRQGAREQMQQFDAQMLNRMQEVLTDEQFATFQEIRQQRQARGMRQGDARRPGERTWQSGERRPERGMRGEARPAAMRGAAMIRHFQNELDLTEAQREEIRSIVSEARSEMRANRGTGEMNREVMRARAQDIQRQISEILTDEQREQVSELLQEHREKMQKQRPARRPGTNG